MLALARQERLPSVPMTKVSQEPLRRFIVLEGGDGTGRSTQLREIAAAFERAGIAYWATSEPTDRPEGLLIRRILSGELPRDPGTLARLFAADRNEHLKAPDGILERLGRGEIVVCDRYILSSLAYQGVACGPELPAELNAGFPLPELLVYFDLPAKESIKRMGNRDVLDIYEELPFQERVRASYRDALSAYSATGMKIVRVDASRSVEEVSRIILDAIAAIGLIPSNRT
jgi:dTMP kinase